jgi:hypothetical protein
MPARNFVRDVLLKLKILFILLFKRSNQEDSLCFYKKLLSQVISLSLSLSFFSRTLDFKKKRNQFLLSLIKKSST